MPFKRLHSNDEYTGSGIGLALCKKIADNLKGSIWVESEMGKGSVFYFTVPKEHSSELLLEEREEGLSKAESPEEEMKKSG